jgi:hypothetical protein
LLHQQHKFTKLRRSVSAVSQSTCRPREELKGLHAAHQSILLNERQGLTELRVICTTAQEWGNPTTQPRGLIPRLLKQSRKVEITVLKWKNHERSKFRTLRYTNSRL